MFGILLRPRLLETPFRQQLTLGTLGLAFVALGVGLRLVRYGLNFPLWGDEASLALNFAERDYRGLLRELNHYQVAPGLFLWLQKAVVGLAGQSEWALRLVPLVAGVGGFVLFARLARGVLPARPAALAVAMLAVAAWPIELASTVKPYSLDLLVAVVYLTLAAGHLRAPRSGAWVLALTAFSPVAAALSYPSIFVGGAVALVLLPRAVRSSSPYVRLRFLAFTVLMAAAFVGHLLVVGREKDPGNPPDLDGYMKAFWVNGFPHDGPAGAAHWLLKAHVGMSFSIPVTFPGGGLIGILLVALGVRKLLRDGRGELVALCALPYALHLCAAVIHRYPYGGNPRLEQHLMPGFCLLAGVGLTALIEWRAAPRQQARRLAAVVVLLAVAGVSGAAADARQPYRDDLTRWFADIRSHLGREARPGDRVVIRGSPAATGLPAFQWHLGRVHGCGTPTGDGSFPPHGRVWVVDARTDFEPVPAAEPAPATPAECLGATGWRVAARTRFRADYDEVRPYVVRYFCDVYCCEWE